MLRSFDELLQQLFEYLCQAVAVAETAHQLGGIHTLAHDVSVGDVSRADKGDGSRRVREEACAGIDATDRPASWAVCQRGKSRCVKTGSQNSPVAVAPFGPARTAVMEPSENPLIQALA